MADPQHDLAILRTKTQMVFAGIETDLVSFLSKKGENVESIISDLLKKRNKELELDAGIDPITEVYYQDLWDLAITLEEDKLIKNRIRELKNRASATNIKNARNAFAHANKPFLKHYWYSVASFASSPELENLGFKETELWLKKAEENNLSSEIRLDKSENYIRHIPNNLPNPEHLETGYFGRSKERQELTKDIRAGRFNQICVCGPGGIGKTALLAHVIKELSVTPLFDFIYFHSFKSEFLIDEGIQTISSSPSISDFEQKFQSFLQHQFEGNTDEIHGLIVLDNLEDLIGTDDSNFIKCIEKLSVNWRIVSTSRLVPNGFKIHTLEPLDEKSLINLGIRYASLTGGKEVAATFEQHKTSVIKRCAQNPLATKLSIDLFRRGIPISEAAEKAILMVTEFSFKNLLQLFDEHTITLLEYLRQGGAADLFTISTELEFNTEYCLKILGKIQNTSLVRSKPGEGQDHLYENTQLTSNFLLSAQDITQITDKVSKIISKRGQQSSAVNSFNMRHFKQYPSVYRMPDDIPQKALPILEELFKIKYFSQALERSKPKREDIPKNMNKLLSDWNSLPDAFKSKKNPYFFLIRGRVFEHLFDQRAEDDFKIFAKYGNWQGMQSAVLGRYYQRQGDFIRAQDFYLAAHKDDEKNPTFIVSYCICLQYTNDPKNISEAIDFIRPMVDVDAKYAHTLVEAVKRKLEGTLVDILLSDVTLAMNLYIKYINEWISRPIAADFIRQLLFATEHPSYFEHEEKISPNLIYDTVYSFISNGGNMKRISEIQNSSVEEHLDAYFKKIGLDCDISQIIDRINSTLESAFSTDTALLNEVKSGNLIAVKIRTVKDKFCFAVDKDNEQFFIHFSSIIEEFDGASDTLLINSVLAIIPKSIDGKEYRVADEAYVVPSDWYDIQN